MGGQVGRRVGRLLPLFCERSARPRSAVNLASGRCPPLAAVWPRLLRTDGGDRAGGGLERSGGGLGRTNGEPIALGGGRGGGGGVCLGIGSDGTGPRGVGLHFRIGGERRDHGGADCKRHHASREPEDGHLTTHPAAPVASEGFWELVAAAQRKVHARGRVFPAFSGQNAALGANGGQKRRRRGRKSGRNRRAGAGLWSQAPKTTASCEVAMARCETCGNDYDKA